MPRVNTGRRFLIRGAIAVAIYLAFLIVIQDILLFPGVLLSYGGSTPPAEVESQFVQTKDGQQIEVWRMAQEGKRVGTALFFHGNGGSLQMFLPFQRWLSSIGYVAYSFDYRGYGRSSGWPTEQGILEDSRATARFIVEREGIPPESLLIVGFSIGSGPAAILASELKSETLVLFAPYSSLKRRVSEELLVGYLTPLLRYEYDTEGAVATLQGACIVLLHGERDNIIGYHHSERIVRARSPDSLTKYLLLSEGRHNEILFQTHSLASAAISECRTGR